MADDDEISRGNPDEARYERLMADMFNEEALLDELVSLLARYNYTVGRLEGLLCAIGKEDVDRLIEERINEGG